MARDPVPELIQIGQGVFAWIHSEPAMGRTNSGVIIDTDGATVVDTQMLPAQAQPFGDAVDALGVLVPRCVLTSGHIEFVGGNGRFWSAAMYGTQLTSAHLDQPADPALYRAFYTDHADQFADEIYTRPVSHVITEATWLTPAIEAIPTAGHTPGNLMVHVPSANVVFAGGMCSFGITPLAFMGHPAAWAQNLDLLLGIPDVKVVPGHGPIGGAEQVRELQGYLRAVVDAGGDPARIAAGPWDSWARRDLDEINVERAALIARGDNSLPASMARALGLA